MFLELKVLVLSFGFSVDCEGWPNVCGEGGIVSTFKVVRISYSPHPFSMIYPLVRVESDVEDGDDEVVASAVVDEWDDDIYGGPISTPGQ